MLLILSGGYDDLVFMSVLLHFLSCLAAAPILVGDLYENSRAHFLMARFSAVLH